MSDGRSYWNKFYLDRKSNAVPLEPSAFARWSVAKFEPHQTVVEFGFGNGRDALWFARQAFRVIGFDFADSAVVQAQGNASEEGLDCTFTQLDLSSTTEVQAVSGRLKSLAGSTISVYGRFLVHSLDEIGRSNFFDLSAAYLSNGGNLYLEFRTGLDENVEHVFGDDHYRVYLDPSTVIAELEARGASILHAEVGYGLAVFKQEDPHVARLIANWPGRR